MENQKFAVYTRTPGAQKPVATEWHYSKPAAESRATKLRQQASSRGWNVSIEVCGPSRAERRAPLSTTLGGSLQRYADGWRWSDGTPEPRVRDMLLSDVAPNFRCISYGCGKTCVEIPAGWRAPRYWPGGRIDTQAALEIDTLLREAGARTAIYLEGLAEALDDHRLTGDGWIVDVAQWDAVMREQCGIWWDKSEEESILAHARDLGYNWPNVAI